MSGKKSKPSQWQEIVKLRTGINEIGTKKIIQRINESKSLFFEKINEISRLLAQLTKRKRGPKLIRSEINKEPSYQTQRNS